MRDRFVNELTNLAAGDPTVFLVTADLGFGIFNTFIDRFPDRFLNVGVAEQSMIGVGTGMALEGWTVFVYSIGNFATLRCLEQIRNDAAYHEANVNIICSGGGFTYGNLGMSHHATEDLAIMRSLPGVTVVAPCDDFETSGAVRALASQRGVGYLRIEKQVPIDTTSLGGFELGKARRIREGQDVTIIACGGLVSEAVGAADLLEQDGLSARVVSMHTLTPVDLAEIVDAARTTGGIVTVEEGQIVGGLGGAVAEVCADSGVRTRVRRLGLRRTYSAIVGDQAYLRQHYGMDRSAIATAARELL
jgi:transketolase